MQANMQAAFQIDKFDRNTCSWDRWVQRLEGAFEVFETKDDRKLHLLLHFIGQEAYDLVCDKLAPISPYKKKYDEIIKVLGEYYNPAPLEIMENFKFQLRKQKEGETVQEYLAALRKAALNCNFGNYLETALRNQFVFGLRSQTIQNRLLESNNLTLTKASEVACALEVSSKNAATLHRATGECNAVTQKYKGNRENLGQPRSNAVRFQKVNTSSNSVNNNVNNTISNLYCFRCGDKAHLAPKCKFMKCKCNFCGIVGHIGKMCLKKNYNNNKFSGKQVNQIESDSNNNKEIDELVLANIDNFRSEDCPKLLFSIVVNGNSMEFEIDTGCPVTICGKRYKEVFFQNFEVFDTNLKLITYCNTNLKIIGYIKVTVTHGEGNSLLPMYIVDTERHALLGREWLKHLRLDWNRILNVNSVSKSVEVQDNRLKVLLETYKVVMEDTMGKITGMQATLNLKADAQPIFFKARSIPFAIKSKVEDELHNLVREGIFVKVDRSEWATPLVPVIKANGAVRLCADYKITINKYLIVDDHPLPRVEELFASLAGGDKFTKLDLTKAYLQLEVRSEDRHLLTVNTHKGLFQPTRLMYGVASAPAIWQRHMEMLLQDIEGVAVFLDDIRITGPDDETHLYRLRTVLERLRDHNMRVNVNKCEFFTDSIQYCGYLINKKGIHKLKSKMLAVQDMKRPSNVEEVRAFVGLINYYGRFLQNLSATLYPINNLLKKNVDFCWDASCEKAFIQVKKEMQSDGFLVHYNPRLPLVLATDASSYGVGAVLSHILEDGSERPIQYASQTLSSTQQKYTQIDKEAYAIIFGIQKFTQYLYGREFILYVDNRPLIQILSPHKGLPTFSALRMQHYELFLRNYTFSIRYRNTKEHCNADAMSRLPVAKVENKIQEPDIVEINLIETLPIRVAELSEATLKDKTVSNLLLGLRTGGEVGPNERFHINQNEFSLQENCLLRGSRVYVPGLLRGKVMAELHSAHFGTSRMKQLARSYCWWEGIDRDIEEVVKNCAKCQSLQPNPPKETFHCWQTPTNPFDRVHVDFAGPFHNLYFFILVDAYSKWPEVHILQNITTYKTIEICRKIFATHGLPLVLVSDHGSQFTSKDFQDFLRENGIIHKMGAPYHPATNGQAERYVRTIKDKLKKLDCPREDIEKQLQNILLTYRKMVHPSTGKSPAVGMFNRDIRSRLDLLIPFKNIHAEKNAYISNREFKEGDRVSVREYLRLRIKWNFGTIIERIGQVRYRVKLDDGRVWERHADQIRAIGQKILGRESLVDLPAEVEDLITIPVPVNSQMIEDHELIDGRGSDVAKPITGVSDLTGGDNSEKARDAAVEDAVLGGTLRKSCRVRKIPQRLNL